MKKFSFPLGKGIYYVQASDESVKKFLEVLQDVSLYVRELLPARIFEFDSFIYSVVNNLDISQLDVSAMDA